jgi:hypothetical protein
MKLKRKMKTLWAVPAVAGSALGLFTAHALPLFPLPPAVANDIQTTANSRIEAQDILAGDYGINGGSYTGDNNTKINITKFGGAGDVGDPMAIGNTGIAWQPQLQGNMGVSSAKRTYDFSSGPERVANGDVNIDNTFAVQFGGGARFWVTDKLSFAPTIMGMYGHTYNSFTGNNNVDYEKAKDDGLIGWNVNTWTIRPAGQIQYVETWKRTIFTFSSDGTYYHTESFTSSNPNFSVNGNSQTWENKIDVDVPLGVELYNHELRTGGYFQRTEFYNDIEKGLNTDHLYEINGRLVLDFLGQLWKLQYIGLGASYLWGSNFHGVSYGIDAAFRF